MRYAAAGDRAPLSRREEAAVTRLLRYGDPLRGPGWNPGSPVDPRLNVPRTRALLDLAGSPDRALACVLIAGTKGKGSTAAFLASVLSRANVRAGLFTSPHLQSWRERIRVDGVAIRPDAFARGVDDALRLVPRLRRRHRWLGEPSAFELLTVAALMHFAARRCAVAVLEVGLGGRYDATNAVAPRASVITSIGLDHQAVLGRTLGRIATEKAGVLRTSSPAFLAPQRPSAARAIERACRESGARCIVVAPLGRAVRLGIAGEHQRVNAALAVAAARAIARDALGPDAVRTGLAAVRWPGRAEVIGARPPIVLDGAHTSESIAALARMLRERYPRRKLHLVFGCTAERDPRRVACALLPLAAAVYATAAAGPRSLAAPLVARALRTASVFPDVAGALAAARAGARAGSIVCVTGSLALVGEARAALGEPVAEGLW